MNRILSEFMGYTPLTDYSKAIMSAVKDKDKLSLPMVENETYVGIEVEVERIFTTANVSVSGDVTLFKNIEDGSLRNSGREFVSIPIKGETIPVSLQALELLLTKHSECVGHEFSDRTSVHVHMNVRDMTPQQIKSLIITYLVVEPFLYHYVGGDRAKNIFCVPLTEATLTRRLNKIINSKTEGDFTSQISDWYKYTGFNLLPILNYGTIEFRHMRGTSDPITLVTWINLLLSLKKFALSTTLEKLKDEVFELNTSSGYGAFIQSIFGDLYREFDTMDYSAVMEPTTTFVKDVFTYAETDLTSVFTDIPEGLQVSKVLSLPFFKATGKRGVLGINDLDSMEEKLLQDIKSYTHERSKYQTALNSLSPEEKSLSVKYKTKIKQFDEQINAYKKELDGLKDGVFSFEDKPKKKSKEARYLDEIPIPPSVGLRREIPAMSDEQAAFVRAETNRIAVELGARNFSTRAPARFTTRTEDWVVDPFSNSTSEPLEEDF
jgi:hypothetical protein